MYKFLLYLLATILIFKSSLAAGEMCKSDICCEPAETGPCRAALRNFYFDTNENKCMGFIYGGCRGNSNRFATLESCQATCEP